MVAHQFVETTALVYLRADPSCQSFDVPLRSQSFQQMLGVVADTASRRPQRIEIKNELHAVH
ncbi:hypothetical protein WS97_17185 [Burkholderia territorii]|nr:hypothetical protein WS97_17185 [Burkholderia territorii]KWA19574.1 hypothetical protein WT37_11290 [Burkholderia territorii]KWO63887.1 hypothetical protein WT98_28020 [Burkholderia territorii]